MAHGRQHAAAVRLGRTYLRAPGALQVVVPDPLEHDSFDDAMAAPADEIPSRPSTAASLFSGNPVVIFAPQSIAGSNLNARPRLNTLVQREQDNLRRAQSAGAILSQRKLLSQSPPTRPQSGRRPRGSNMTD